MVVNDVPVRELLFALARDATVNIDIHPGVSGNVTLNAIEQTLPQILERIAGQVDIRYQERDGAYVISPDTATVRSYRIDYVNMQRDSTLQMQVSTQIEAAGQNNSAADIRSVSNNRFWQTLSVNLLALLGETVPIDDEGKLPASDKVIANPEAGLVLVNATERQHRRVQAFIDAVLASAQRQVMIEATIVEVRLDDRYQTGIDWTLVRQAGRAGLGSVLTLAGTPASGEVPTLVFNYTDPNKEGLDVSATINLLERFGTTRVLSSPRIMAMNNQTAVLKVSENRVYFTVEGTIRDIEGTASGFSRRETIFTTTAHTVPVGFVMNVTPQINDNDVVLLNVRPTISRIIGYVRDPNPSLVREDGKEIVSEIPEIAVRELESLLRLTNGQIAVLGGLMQDTVFKGSERVPLLSRVPLLGEGLFTGRSNDTVKTELVVFIRPVIVRNPSLRQDLGDYGRFLERQTGAAQ
ncbi:MAG: hypothetical protein IT494_00180 [Gammaproteobacteria bacterium]|nr:hypothetical protein [Gammaproteobacteria bacterium]